MSVINQMLKDLEQRAPETGQSSIPAVGPQKTSTLKIVFVSALILLSLNALGFYILNLQERVAVSEVLERVVEMNACGCSRSSSSLVDH